jgi:hypothetical protein
MYSLWINNILVNFRFVLNKIRQKAKILTGQHFARTIRGHLLKKKQHFPIAVLLLLVLVLWLWQE